MAGCSSFLILLPYGLRYRAFIEDITLDKADGRCRVIIRTHGKHWLPHRSVKSYVKESVSRFRASHVGDIGGVGRGNVVCGAVFGAWKEI